jgi:hypothetical protein
MKCASPNCNKEGTVMGGLYDNLTHKSYEVWTCEEHIPNTLDKLMSLRITN